MTVSRGSFENMMLFEVFLHEVGATEYGCLFPFLQVFTPHP